MPILKFQLRNSLLCLDVSSESEDWELTFDAVNVPTSEKSYQTFTIFSHGLEYDGYASNGRFNIKPMMPNLKQPSDQENVGIGNIKCLHSHEFGENIPPVFEAEFFLSVESFRQLVEIDTRTVTVELWVTTADEKGLIYGEDPDGNELEWRLEGSGRGDSSAGISNAKEISFRFNVKADEIVEENKPLTEYEQNVLKYISGIDKKITYGLIIIVIVLILAAF